MKKNASLIFLLTMLTLMLTGCGIVIQTNGSGNKSAGSAVTRTLSTKSFNSIKTRTSISDIEIKKGNTYKVTYHGHKNITPTAKVENGVLTIDQDSFSASYSGEDKITIVVPKKLKNISINSSEGDIEIDELATIAGQIESSEGDIDIKRLTTQNNFSINSSEGDIDITSVIMQNGLSVNTSEGDVEIDQINASGYDLITSEGDISVNGKDHSGDDTSRYQDNSNSKNVLKIRASEGDITIE